MRAFAHPTVLPEIQTRAKRENRRLDSAHCRSIRASARPPALAEAGARCAWAWSGRGGPKILRWRRQDIRVARDGRRNRERLRPRSTDGLTKPAQRRSRMNAESHQHYAESGRDPAEAQQDLTDRRHDPNIIRIGRVVDNGEFVAAVHVRIAKDRPAPHQLAHFSRRKREAELHARYAGELGFSRAQLALHVLRFIAGHRLARTAFPNALEFDGALVRIRDKSCGSSHAEKVMARALNQGITAKASNAGPKHEYLRSETHGHNSAAGRPLPRCAKPNSLTRVESR